MLISASLRSTLRKKREIDVSKTLGKRADTIKKVVPNRTPCNAMRSCVIKFNVMQVLLFDFIEGN